MKKTLTFQRPSQYPSSELAINWYFPFNVVDSSLVGTPEEMSRTLPCGITVTATIQLVYAWGFYAIERGDISAKNDHHNLMKILFEYGHRYVTQQLKETGALDADEKLRLDTSNAEVPYPYDPSRIKEPNGFIIEVEVNGHKEQNHLDEASITSISGGASITSSEDTNISGDVVGRDKIVNTTNTTNVTNITYGSPEQQPARSSEKRFLIGEQLRLAREGTGLSSTKFIDLIDFDSEQQYRDMEANRLECPESVINQIYETTGILPGWLKDPATQKYEVESAHQWLRFPRETANHVSQQAKDEIYVTIAVSIPAKDHLLWRAKNLWAEMAGHYLHVGVCVPISDYRYLLFDTKFPANFRNEHDRMKYAPAFFLFLQELFDRFDIGCRGLILSDFKADNNLYEGKVYPRQVLSGPKVWGRINWVQAVLDRSSRRDKSYLVKNCGSWIKDMRKAFLEVSETATRSRL